MRHTASLATGLALALWVTAVACFVVGTWGGRPSALRVVAPIVVIYVIMLAWRRLRG
jgi:hypothetical protein